MKKLFTILALLMAMSLLLIPVTNAQDPVEIRWFVGLGAGSDAEVIDAQQAVVDEFNASQDGIELVLEIVDNDFARDTLNTQIAAGNAPDIVGPMGILGRSQFPGVWMDLSELIEANEYDLTDFDPALVDFYKVEGQGQLGIPFAVFPSFLLYNVDLFDEAGIPYPPRNYGEPYIDWDGNEREWNMDTLREVAMILTVDANGNDATMDEFDSDNIIQFGFGSQWTDIRGRLTIFGAGNFVDADGNAVMPEHWREGLEWMHDAMWVDYFYPNGNYGGADFLGAGNWFESGNMAMINIHLWYTSCCIFGLESDWQVGPIPSYNGVTTSKLHADTFGILKSTEHPQEAFEVMTYLLGERANDLAKIYGGMPARLSLQGNYFDQLGQQEPYAGREVHWDIIADGLKYPDNPNHEEGLPSFNEANDRYISFNQEFDSNPDFDLDAEVESLLADLQAIYDASGE